MNILDIIFFVVILFCAIGAMLKGFIKAILSKVAVILGILLAIVFYDDFAVVLNAKISSMIICKILSALIIFVVVYLIIMIIQKILSHIFSGEILKGLDRTLGFFFGLVGGILIVFVVLKLLTMQSFFDITSLVNDSFFDSIYDKFFSPEIIKPLESPAAEQPTKTSLLLNNGLMNV